MNGIVFFDVDNVLFDGQSQMYLVRFLYKRRLISIFFLMKIILWFLFYKFNLVRNIETFRAKALLMFKGWNVQETKIVYKEFYYEIIKPRLIKKSLDFIKKHQEEKRQIVLLSASLEEIVGLIAQDLDIEYVIATKLETKDGFYTGKISGDVPYGVKKRSLADNFLQEHKWLKEDTYAYSDHISDKELLEYVKKPVVVNPDRELKKYSEEKCWESVEFSNG